MQKGVEWRIVSLVWLNALISSLHVCLGITMSTHLLMLKVVRSAISDARRRFDCQRFKEDESKCKKECCKARVDYEGPQENEDYLLGSVDREEKKMAHRFTDIRRNRLDKRCKREYERERKGDDKRREIIWGKPYNNDPNKQKQHVCAVCDTVRIGSKELTSMSKKSSCQTKLASA